MKIHQQNTNSVSAGELRKQRMVGYSCKTPCLLPIHPERANNLYKPNVLSSRPHVTTTYSL